MNTMFIAPSHNFEADAMPRSWLACTIALMSLVAMAGCSESATTDSASSKPSATAGTVRADGSSTVYPITEAVAEEFRSEHPEVRAVIGFSGTGGGFKKLAAGEVDICDASRTIKDEERAACEANGIKYIELEIAYDGLSVVVNPENDWCDCLTVEQLKAIWQPESAVSKWSDLNPEWPEEKIELFGPGTDSGTFDYFTEVIVGTAKSVDAGDGKCIQPSLETVRSNTYKPLSRPLFIYVNVASLQKPEIVEFVRYYLDTVGDLVTSVGYVPLSDDLAAKSKQVFDEALAAAKAN
jgi:phosphate transport system substrate-binding protein